MKHNKEITIEENGRVRVRTINTLRTRTHQEFKEQCDVNNIIAKYKKTGEVTHLARKSGLYADISQIPDYAEAMQKIVNAQNAFSSLSSELRTRFNNDPANLITFLQDPKNHDEGVKLGLFEPKKSTNVRDELNDARENVSTSKTKVPKKTPSTPPEEE